MCGILGFVKGRKEIPEPILKSILKPMFLACQNRGSDATGYAYVNGKHIYVRKSPVPATTFVKTLDCDRWDGVNIFIGHCRAATNGKPSQNENNHPIISKVSKIAIAHNGVVSTKVRDLKVDSECDSELILRLIEQKNSILKGIQYADENIWGSATYSLIGASFPNILYLVRDSNPLALAYLPEFDLILYASTKEIIKAGVSTYHQKFGFFSDRKYRYKVIFEECPDDTILIIKRSENGAINIDQKKLNGGQMVTTYPVSQQYNPQTHLWEPRVQYDEFINRKEYVDEEV